MGMQSVKRKVLLPAGILLAVGMTACSYGPHYSAPPPHPGTVYYYPYDYDYYYYPNVRVYFQYSTGYYYYRMGDRWERSRALPPRYHLDPRTRVKVRVKEPPRPYIHDRAHYKQYVPQKKYQPQPQLDRQEREHNRRTYEVQSKERQKYMDERQRRDRR